MHMKVGYIRVSTEEQNTIRQEVLMQDLGVERVLHGQSEWQRAAQAGRSWRQ